MLMGDVLSALCGVVLCVVIVRVAAPCYSSLSQYTGRTHYMICYCLGLDVLRHLMSRLSATSCVLLVPYTSYVSPPLVVSCARVGCDGIWVCF